MDMQRVLIVEDDAALSSTLRSALAGQAGQVCVARTLAEAAVWLEPAPCMALLDFQLPDGTIEPLLERLCDARPLPLIIAMSGAASTEAVFRLARRGVRGFLQKPFDLHQLAAVCRASRDQAPEVAGLAREAVGKVSLQAFESQARGAMLEEALAQCQGSRRGAARLLDVSRQLLQHMLKKQG